MPPKRSKASSQTASTSRRQKRIRETSPPPPPLPWPLATQAHQAKYRVLAKRTIAPSKFLDSNTLQTLGLQDDVHAFLSHIGCSQFAVLQSPTYREVTYEILSTFYTDYDPHDRSDRHCIRFQCLGEERRLTIRDFNSIFGFPSEGATWTNRDFVAHQAWDALTGQPEYDPSKSKSSYIHNHALRYIHRVLSSSIFGRGESTGVVSKMELFFLWAMTNGVQVNAGAWFLRHINHVTKSSTGKICIGGLLSVIAAAFGFIPIAGAHHMVEGGHLLDMDTLLRMKLCRNVGGGYFRLLDAEGQVIPPEEADPYDLPEDAAQFPDPDEPVDTAAFHEPTADDSSFPAPSSSSADMSQLLHQFQHLHTRLDRQAELLERYDTNMGQQRDLLERIDARLAQQEETQRQLTALLHRLEDKFSHPK